MQTVSETDEEDGMVGAGWDAGLPLLRHWGQWRRAYRRLRYPWLYGHNLLPRDELNIGRVLRCKCIPIEEG